MRWSPGLRLVQKTAKLLITSLFRLSKETEEAGHRRTTQVREALVTLVLISQSGLD